MYFPSYEIQLDDLRDYRFYEEDMLHPNKVAISYIWERFQETFFSTDTLSVMKALAKITQATHHRPFHATGEAFQTFARQQLEKIHQLQVQQGIDLSVEANYFKDFLKQ